MRGCGDNIDVRLFEPRRAADCCERERAIERAARAIAGNPLENEMMCTRTDRDCDNSAKCKAGSETCKLSIVVDQTFDDYDTYKGVLSHWKLWDAVGGAEGEEDYHCCHHHCLSDGGNYYGYFVVVEAVKMDSGS